MDIFKSFNKIRDLLLQTQLTDEDRSRIRQAVTHLNPAGFDPWGVSPGTLETFLAFIKPLYSKYFRVETHRIDRVPQGRVLLIANHGGQLPLDGIMIGTSMLLEANPPRLARGMVERWAPSLPFVSVFFARAGQVVGDHRNCRELLEHDECVLVFPEGVGGSGKTIDKRYQLQDFGTGFMRLSLETKTPIIPVAVIGGEETYPAVYDAKFFAKLIGAPYFPVTPLFPALGPLGVLPLPCKITLRFGEPILFDADPECSDKEIEGLIQTVKSALQKEIDEGVQLRGDRIFTGAAK